MILDNPGRLQNTPKYFEQKRRDATAKVLADHRCDDITSETMILHKCTFLNIVQQRKGPKCGLAVFISLTFLVFGSCQRLSKY